MSVPPRLLLPLDDPVWEKVTTLPLCRSCRSASGRLARAPLEARVGVGAPATFTSSRRSSLGKSYDFATLS